MDPEQVEGSSNIKSYTHDSREDTLDVEFHSGKVYRYHGVPLSLHKGLQGAISKGKYLHQNIYGKFEAERIG